MTDSISPRFRLDYLAITPNRSDQLTNSVYKKITQVCYGPHQGPWVS
jgi:hypothetical protein